MIDETQGNEWTTESSAAAAGEQAATSASAAGTGAEATAAGASANDPAGFCQDCGRVLTRATARPVGSGLFCEPCLQVRLAGGIPGSAPYTASYRPTGPDGMPLPDAPTGTMPAAPGEPSPAVAGLLGLIPGVGAMYNGQVAKGFAHIIIFTALMLFSDHVSGVFGILVAGWICYQVFDAIHTARARRDGLPLPNTFGLNDIGERLGHRGQWPYTPAAAAYTAYPPRTPSGWGEGAAATANPVPNPQTGWNAPPAADASTGVPQPNAAQYANWAGYVPPQVFPAPGTPYSAPNPYGAGSPYGPGTPYAAGTPNAAGTSYTPVADPLADPSAAPAVPPARSFPGVAVLLIAFGLLFLLANLLPDWHLRGRWITPVVLLMLAGWVLVRRLPLLQQLRESEADSGTVFLRSIVYLRSPLVLAVLAFLFILQAEGVATLGMTWPVLVILGGVLLLIDRSTGLVRPPMAPMAPLTPATAAGTPQVSTIQEASAARASFTPEERR